MTERWRFPIGGVHPMAPTIVDGVVYCGGECLFALDCETGEEMWRVCPRSPDTELAQRLPPIDNSGALLRLVRDGAISYGDWCLTQKGLVSTTPVVQDGNVYFGDTNGALYAVDAGSGQVIWIDDAPGPPHVSSPLILDDVIWAGSINKRQYIHDRATGEPLWHFRAFSLVLGPASLRDGVVYFADESLVTAMPRSEVGKSDGEVLWDRSYTQQYDRSVNQQRAPTTGMVYIVDAYPTVKIEDVLSPILLAISDDRLVVAARDLDGDRGYLAAVIRSDGTLLWRRPLGLGNGPALVAGSRAVVAEREDVAAFSIDDGSEIWRTSTGIASAPTLAGNAVYVGIRSEFATGALAVVDVETGVVLSLIEVGDVEGLGSPAVANGAVFVGSVNLGRQDGYLFAFDDPISTHHWAEES